MNDIQPLSPDTPLVWSTIRVTGEDAVSFLQGQLTADVVGRATDTLLLTPVSVVLCDARLTYDEDGVSLTMHQESCDAALQRLRRFVLRSRCSFEVLASSHHDLPTTVGEQVTAGAPGPREYAAELTPHSFGASFVKRHVSFTKGCFTGQELVGRLDARGANVPFRIAQFWAPTWQEAHELVTGYGPAGGHQRLSTVVRDGDGVRGLAVVHRTLLDATTLPVRFVAAG